MTKKKDILRVNPDGAGYVQRDKTTRAGVAVRRNSTYTPRVREFAEALPHSHNIWSAELYDGADLKPFDGRPGSLDFLKCPSLGLGSPT